MSFKDYGNSMQDLTFTYVKTGYTCLKSAWDAHIVFAYFVFFTGIFAMLSRVVPSMHKSHKFWGRAYIMSMLWCVATSLLCFNNGLPDGVLVSFLWVLVGLCVGWVVINVHQELMERKAMQNISEAMKLGKEVSPEGLFTEVAAEKGRIANSKTWYERFFSWKSLHGMLMFMSWVNIAGRLVITNPVHFQCYTYPYYKQVNSTKFAGAGKPLTPVGIWDTSSTPWAMMGLANWGVLMSLGMIAIAALVGIVVSCVCARSRTPVSAMNLGSSAEATEAVEKEQ